MVMLRKPYAISLFGTARDRPGPLVASSNPAGAIFSSLFYKGFRDTSGSEHQERINYKAALHSVTSLPDDRWRRQLCIPASVDMKIPLDCDADLMHCPVVD
jgi:hypothetical protein